MIFQLNLPAFYVDEKNEQLILGKQHKYSIQLNKTNHNNNEELKFRIFNEEDQDEHLMKKIIIRVTNIPIQV